MFRLFGFPVHVRAGFVVFMVLIVAMYGDEFGLWLAVTIAGFTLLHELGHAVAARRTGANAEISLSFFVGYASFVPTRRLTHLERAGISVAGPGIQIITSVVILLAMGYQPFDYDALRGSPAALAVFWAGPVIGLLNLIPVLPLDGGHIVLSGLDFLIKERARRVMIIGSLVATVLAGITLALAGHFPGFGLFIAFIFVAQLQLYFADRQPKTPWVAARDALRAGKPGKARRILVATISTPQQTTESPLGELSPVDVADLVSILPDPLPSGDPWNEYLLANFLIGVGRYEDAAHYAADSYSRHPNSLVAATIARAAAALGDQATAIGWLRAAADTSTSDAGLASLIDRAPELVGVRQHPDVVAIRRTLMV